MVSLCGHDAGNGGNRHGEPTPAGRDLHYSEANSRMSWGRALANVTVP